MMVPDDFEPNDFYCEKQETDTLSCDDLVCKNTLGGNGVWELWRFWNYSNYETNGGTRINFEEGGIYNLNDNEGSPEIRGFYKFINDCEEIIFEGLSNPFKLDTFEIVTLDAQKMLLFNNKLCSDTCLFISVPYSDIAWSRHCELKGDESNFYPCSDCPFGESGIKCNNEYRVNELGSKLLDIVDFPNEYCVLEENAVTFLSKDNLRQISTFFVGADVELFTKYDANSILFTTSDSIFIADNQNILEKHSFDDYVSRNDIQVFYNNRIYVFDWEAKIFSTSGELIREIDLTTSLTHYEYFAVWNDKIVLKDGKELVFIDENGIIENEVLLNGISNYYNPPMALNDDKLVVLNQDGLLSCYDMDFNVEWEREIKPDVFDWVSLEEERLEEGRIFIDDDLIILFLEGANSSVPDRSIISKYSFNGDHDYTTDLSISNISFEDGPYGIGCFKLDQDNMLYIARIFREGSQGILKVNMNHDINESRVDICIW